MAVADELEDMAGNEPLPGGELHIHRPIVFGPNYDTATTAVRGVGMPYNGQLDPWPNSTAIVADFDDAPAVTLVRGRNSSVKDLGIYGPLSILYQAALLDTPDRSGWPGVYDRYSPCAGIVIDDTVDGGSEHTTIENVDLGGFQLAIGAHVNGTNGNGDDLTLRNVRFAGNVTAIDICHDQARVLRVEGVEAIYCHTFLTNRLHGMRNGKLGARISGMMFNGVYQLCDIAQGTAGSVRFVSGDGEKVGWYGDFTDDGARTFVRTAFVDMDLRFDLPCRPGILAKGGHLLLDGGSIQCDDLPVFDSEIQIRGTAVRPGRYEDGSIYSEGRRRAANNFPVIDRPNYAKQGTRLEDVGSSAYFPNLDDPSWPEQYQIGKLGPRKARHYDAREKSACYYDPMTETIQFPTTAFPKAGDLVIDDADMTAWVVDEAYGPTAKLDRLNHFGKTVSTAGYFYIVWS